MLHAACLALARLGVGLALAGCAGTLAGTLAGITWYLQVQTTESGERVHRFIEALNRSIVEGFADTAALRECPRLHRCLLRASDDRLFFVHHPFLPYAFAIHVLFSMHAFMQWCQLAVTTHVAAAVAEAYLTAVRFSWHHRTVVRPQNACDLCVKLFLPLVAFVTPLFRTYKLVFECGQHTIALSCVFMLLTAVRVARDENLTFKICGFSCLF
jgi:hypothetical protein